MLTSEKKPNESPEPKSSREVRCSTDFGTRKCNKYLGTFSILIGKLYCKSCGKSNYYEVVTEEGLHKALHS